MIFLSLLISWSLWVKCAYIYTFHDNNYKPLKRNMINNVQGDEKCRLQMIRIILGAKMLIVYNRKLLITYIYNIKLYVKKYSVYQ